MVNDAAAAKAMSSASERVVEKSSSEDELFVTPNGNNYRELDPSEGYHIQRRSEQESREGDEEKKAHLFVHWRRKLSVRPELE